MYTPIFSPISAAIMQRISIPSAVGYIFFVMFKNNLLFDFRDKSGRYKSGDKDFFLNILV
jgi:hypothetical protein